MPIQPKTNLVFVLGTVLWGDLAELTFYRQPSGKVVSFAKTYPDKPPSPQQLIQRGLLTTAAAAWKALTQSQREQWAAAARRASLCMHGYDLWIHHQLIGDDAAIRTLERQTHTTLLP